MPRKYTRKKLLSENLSRSGRKSKQFTQEQIDEVRELRQSGKTQNEIVIQMRSGNTGINRYYVQKILGLSNTRGRPPVRRPNILGLSTEPEILPDFDSITVRDSFDITENHEHQEQQDPSENLEQD